MIRNLLLLLILMPFWAQAETHSITVNGSGTVTAEPDRAVFHVGFSDTQSNVDSAARIVDSNIAKLLDALNEFDIDKQSLDSSQSNIHPNYRWDKNSNERILTGYTVSRQVTLELNTLGELPKLMARLAASEPQSLSGPALTTSKREQLKLTALENAFENAKAKAEALARASGTAVTGVISIAETGSRGPIIQPRMAMAADAEMGNRVETGQIDIQAEISVVFSIE